MCAGAGAGARFSSTKQCTVLDQSFVSSPGGRPSVTRPRSQRFASPLLPTHQPCGPGVGGSGVGVRPRYRYVAATPAIAKSGRLPATESVNDRRIKVRVGYKSVGADGGCAICTSVRALHFRHEGQEYSSFCPGYRKITIATAALTLIQDCPRHRYLQSNYILCDNIPIKSNSEASRRAE